MLQEQVKSPTTIRIPKVDAQKSYTLKVFKSKTLNFKGYSILYLKQHKLEGIVIPNEFEVKLNKNDICFSYSRDVIELKGEILNKILRFLYLEGLRNLNKA
jgi:hypothetical protein